MNTSGLHAKLEALIRKNRKQKYWDIGFSAFFIVVGLFGSSYEPFVNIGVIPLNQLLVILGAVILGITFGKLNQKKEELELLKQFAEKLKLYEKNT